jgi:hypothetical protein
VNTSTPALLRVSVAALCRVVFDHPHDHSTWLAFERRATLLPGPPPQVGVTVVAYGGAVRLIEPGALAGLVPDFCYDSARSEAEQDFRILIPPAAWPAVRDFCLTQLSNPESDVLDATPHRELSEEFDETLHWQVSPGQYDTSVLGTVVEAVPVPTDNPRAQGAPTVRVYRIFENRLLDQALIGALLSSVQRSDAELAADAAADAAHGGPGRANAACALPLTEVTSALTALSPGARAQPFSVAGHRLDASISALFPDLFVPTRSWHSRNE